MQEAQGLKTVDPNLYHWSPWRKVSIFVSLKEFLSPTQTQGMIFKKKSHGVNASNVGKSCFLLHFSENKCVLLFAEDQEPGHCSHLYSWITDDDGYSIAFS